MKLGIQTSPCQIDRSFAFAMESVLSLRRPTRAVKILRLEDAGVADLFARRFNGVSLEEGVIERGQAIAPGIGWQRL